MARELDPRAVAVRLAELRALYVPETVAAAAERLARERPPSSESFDERVARNLMELRALCDLTRYLGQAQFPLP